MNAQQAAFFASESNIGPPSELISISGFIEQCSSTLPEDEQTIDEQSGMPDAGEECRYVLLQGLYMKLTVCYAYL